MSWPNTKHCSHCYRTLNHKGFNVGHWWNNDPYLAKVCSEKCKDKLWKMMQDGTWMSHKPKAMFPEATQKVSKGPVAFTDTQFETTD